MVFMVKSPDLSARKTWETVLTDGENITELPPSWLMVCTSPPEIPGRLRTLAVCLAG